MDKANIYIGEIQTQIEFAKKAFDEYLETKKKEDLLSIFYHIHHFLIHVTNIDKLIDTSANSFRSSIINNRFFTDNHVDLKQFRKLRNHLEHFDKRLDMWVKNYDGAAFFDMNIITGAKGFPEKAFLRALDGDIFKFHGESYNLKNLIEEVEKIEKIIKIYLERLTK